jgi:hypothetical protein
MDIQGAIWQQHQIGWRQFLECLPAQTWKTLQMQFYRDEGRRKSSRKWMVSLVKRLHNLGHRKWQHRCKVKAEETQPDDRKFTEMLDEEVEEEYMKGSNTLFEGDKLLLQCNESYKSSEEVAGLQERVVDENLDGVAEILPEGRKG